MNGFPFIGLTLGMDPMLRKTLFTAAMAVMLFTGKRVSRWEGGILLAGYAVFIALLLIFRNPGG